jgi:hypothetical protein
MTQSLHSLRIVSARVRTGEALHINTTNSSKRRTTHHDTHSLLCPSSPHSTPSTLSPITQDIDNTKDPTGRDKEERARR